MPENYKIFKVSNRINDSVEFWKAPSYGDLLAWIHDSYGCTITDMLGYEVLEVTPKDASMLMVSKDHREACEDVLLYELFNNADNGCVLLASTG